MVRRAATAPTRHRVGCRPRLTAVLTRVAPVAWAAPLAPAWTRLLPVQVAWALMRAWMRVRRARMWVRRARVAPATVVPCSLLRTCSPWVGATPAPICARARSNAGARIRRASWAMARGRVPAPLSQSPWSAISSRSPPGASAAHTCARLSTRQVKCWGDNLLSHLGWVKTLAFQATAFSMMVGYRVADGLSTRSAQRI